MSDEPELPPDFLRSERWAEIEIAARLDAEAERASTERKALEESVLEFLLELVNRYMFKGDALRKLKAKREAKALAKLITEGLEDWATEFARRLTADYAKERIEVILLNNLPMDLVDEYGLGRLVLEVDKRRLRTLESTQRRMNVLRNRIAHAETRYRHIYGETCRLKRQRMFMTSAGFAPATTRLACMPTASRVWYRRRTDSQTKS